MEFHMTGMEADNAVAPEGERTLLLLSVCRQKNAFNQSGNKVM